MDEHELVSKLKEIAVDLGKQPSRDQFVQISGITRECIDKHFGSYTGFLQAAGFSKNQKNHKPTFQKSFAEPLDERLSKETYVKPIRFEWDKSGCIVTIPDLHFPFVSVDALTQFYCKLEMIKDRVQYVVQMGDLFDMLAQSKFPRSINYFSPDEEIRLARTMAAEMWAKIRSICPKAKCVQILGNHDKRPVLRALESLPFAETAIKEWTENLFVFDGVFTVMDTREVLLIGDVCFHHGFLSKLGDHRDSFMMNTVVGHTHRGGTVFRNVRQAIYSDKMEVINVIEKQIWELNAGLMGNPFSKALGYTPTKVNNWTIGFGIIDLDGPRFVPLT